MVLDGYTRWPEVEMNDMKLVGIVFGIAAS